MAPSFTPGPWEVRTIDGSLGTVDTQCGGTTVAQAMEVSPKDRNAGSPERKANARLIAAALDLLDACEEALGALNGAEYALPGYVVAAMERAIAKATGGSHA